MDKINNSNDKEREYVFELIQNHLKSTPLIVWGSGATIPLGLPRMEDLNQALKTKLNIFDKDCVNLETELSKDKYQQHLPEIRKIIWDEVYKQDIKFLKSLLNEDRHQMSTAISRLIKFFLKNDPRILNIITTNYDRVLEYIMSYQQTKFTDGFGGEILSTFKLEGLNTQRSKEGKVNLVKPHGSLNWFEINDKIRYYHSHNDNIHPKIIAPGKKKFEDAQGLPYRALIQKSDNLINDSQSFLVIGFGFNDQHLTPLINDKIQSGTPLVIITKAATEGINEMLKLAQNYVLMSSTSQKQTKVQYKRNNDKGVIILNGEYWALPQFMEILEHE